MISKPSQCEPTSSKSTDDSAETSGASVVDHHRHELARLRAVVEELMAELEAASPPPGLLGRVQKTLRMKKPAPTAEQHQAMRDLSSSIARLPQRVKILKALVEAMHMIIEAEREAWGLDAQAAAGGGPLVLIRDFTGRGDRDAPVRL